MKYLSIFLFALVLTAGVATAQSGSTATVNQSGGGNDATVSQTGSSTATVTQADGHTATVSQTGSNTATVAGKGANISSATQDGSGNRLFQTQGDAGSPPVHGVGNSVTASQVGTFNYAKQEQFGGTGNDFSVTQSGDRNHSEQYEINGDLNVITADQDGTYNTAIQRDFSRDGGMASIQQDGDWNSGLQHNIQGTATIQQIGTGVYTPGPGGGYEKNEAYQRFVDATSTAEIYQSGKLNIADQTFNPAGGSGFDATNSAMYFDQQGEGNWAKVVMSGDGNLALVDQIGSYNTVRGLTAGSVAQVFGGSNLTVMQNGSLNTAIIDMTSGGMASVTQSGASNTATVIQN